MSDTQSSSSEHCWFVPGRVSCLLKDTQDISPRQFLLEPAPFPDAGDDQGGTELFRSQSCLQPARRAPTPECWHRQGALTRLLPPVAPSVETATAKLLPTGKKGPQIPGFRIYGHSRSRRNRLQNVHHHQHSSH